MICKVIRILPASQGVYNAGKLIKNAFYCLNNERGLINQSASVSLRVLYLNISARSVIRINKITFYYEIIKD